MPNRPPVTNSEFGILNSELPVRTPAEISDFGFGICRPATRREFEMTNEE